jgi:hypothetical protein
MPAAVLCMVGSSTCAFAEATHDWAMWFAMLAIIGVLAALVVLVVVLARSWTGRRGSNRDRAYDC